MDNIDRDNQVKNQMNTQSNQVANEPVKKARKEKYKIDAEKQVKKVILEIRKLAELALKHKGEFTQEETNKIFDTIRYETTESRKNFKLEKDDLDFKL